MALRALQGPTGGGSPVGGTGTTNTIPRWTGPSTLGDSGLIDNGTAIYTTTRDVGFGIASPNAARFQSVGVDDKWAARLHGSTTVGKSYGALIEAGTNSGDIALRVRAAGAGSDYLYVRGDGIVGIGTASPNGKFEVYGSAASAASIRATYYGAGNRSIRIFADTVCLLETTTDDDLWLRRNSALVAKVISTGIDVSTSGYGLKLPATPGNADTQTLDAYRENTFTTTTSSATNCSSITLSNLRYTQIGRLVTIEGTASFVVTAATTATSFYFTLPSGCNRGSTANAGAGLAVDNATGYSGALWNLANTNNDVLLYFNASNPFGAGTSRTVPFSYSYYTASS